MRKKVSILLVCLFVFLTSCGKTKPKFLGSIPKKMTCVAVFPFDVRHDQESYDEMLSEFMTLELLKNGIKVVGPQDLSQAFKSANQSLPPSVDAYWARRIGKQLQVDGVVFGQISRIPMSLSVVDDQTLKPLNLSIETYFMSVGSGEVLWTYSDRQLIDSDRYVEWFSQESQSIVKSMFMYTGPSLEKTGTCGVLPKPVKIVEKPKAQAESSKLLPLSVQQEKIKTSLESLMKLPHTIFTGRNAAISDDQSHVLKDVAEVLKRDEANYVTIIGHVDSTNEASSDLELSTARAKAIYDRLVKLGVSAKQVTYQGEGGTHPVVPNLFEKSRELNRRTEIKRKKP